MTARSEDRGVQVEARTLSREHLGRTVALVAADDGLVAGIITSVEHYVASVTVVVDSYGDLVAWSAEPDALVTLTDGDAR